MNVEQEHAAMVAKLIKDPAKILADMNEFKAGLIHAALGIAGEVGEMYSLEDNDQHLTEETGDLLFYCQDMRRVAGLPAFAPGKQGMDLSVASGIIVDLVKKHVVYGQSLNFVKLTEAMDQLESRISGWLEHHGKTRQDSLRHNIAKLLTGPNARYGTGVYSDAAAAARADKQQEARYATSWGTGEVEPLLSSRPPTMVLPGGGRAVLREYAAPGEFIYHKLLLFEPGSTTASAEVEIDHCGEVDSVNVAAGVNVHNLRHGAQ